jgi:hypothetical protein
MWPTERLSTLGHRLTTVSGQKHRQGETRWECQNVRFGSEADSLHSTVLCLLYPGKRTSQRLAARRIYEDTPHEGFRRILGPLVRLARSTILSIALCHPASASFNAFPAAARGSATSGVTCSSSR